MLLFHCIVALGASHSGTCGEQVTWSLTSSGALTFTGQGPMYESEEGQYEWLALDSAGTRITSVEIEEGIINIPMKAFYNLDGLASVTISVSTIGDHAFWSCSELKTVSLLPGVKTIGYGVFQYCSKLKSLTIPDTVTEIGDLAFYWCNMPSITLPSSLTKLGYGAFWQCDSLTGTVEIPKGVIELNSCTFQSTAITEVSLLGVRYIGYEVFECCSQLKTVRYWDCVSPVWYGSPFDNWQFDLYLPVNYHTSSWCGVDFTEFKSVSKSLTEADHKWEYGTITYRYYPDSKCVMVNGSGTMPYHENDEYVPQYPWTGLEVTSAIIGDGVTDVGPYAFCNTRFTSGVILPDSCLWIDEGAFINTVIGEKEKLVMNKVMYIGARAFFNADLTTTITIPNSVRYIKSEAFSYEDARLRRTRVLIGANVDYIGDNAFGDPDEICFYGIEEPSYGSSMDVGKVYVPDLYMTDSFCGCSVSGRFPDPIFEGTHGSKITYQFHEPNLIISGTGKIEVIQIPVLIEDFYPAWNRYGYLVREITICEGIESIDSYAFEWLRSVDFVNVHICSSVTTISSHSFHYCRIFMFCYLGLSNPCSELSIESIFYGDNSQPAQIMVLEDYQDTVFGSNGNIVRVNPFELREPEYVPPLSWPHITPTPTPDPVPSNPDEVLPPVNTGDSAPGVQDEAADRAVDFSLSFDSSALIYIVLFGAAIDLVLLVCILICAKRNTFCFK